MVIESVSRVIQYLTLDIEFIAAAFGRGRGNSQIAIGVALPTLSAERTNVVLQFGEPLPGSKLQGKAVGDNRKQQRSEQSANTSRPITTASLDLLYRIAAIAISFVQPSRGVRGHSKRSRSPWKRFWSRSLRLRSR